MKKTKTKIMLSGWFFYPKIGGAETIMLYQAKWLIKQGYDVTIFTSVLNTKNKTEQDSYFGINIIRKQYIDAKLKFSPSKLIQIEKDFSNILEEIKPDIIHCHNWSYPSSSDNKKEGAKLILSLVKKIKETNTILIEHAHNAQLKQPEATKVLRDINWDCLICVSDFVKINWENLGNNAKEINVVYNGIDLKKFVQVKPNTKMLDIKMEEKKLYSFQPEY